MAAFPAYVKIKYGSYGETTTPVVERAPMERGFAKVRRINADAIVTVAVTLQYMSAADYASFRTWMFDNAAGAAGGAAFFDWYDRRAAVTRQARLLPASFGPLTPMLPAFGYMEQQAALEYLETLA